MATVETFLIELKAMGQGHLPLKETRPHEVCYFTDNKGNMRSQRTPRVFYDIYGDELKEKSQIILLRTSSVRICRCTMPVLKSYETISQAENNLSVKSADSNPSSLGSSRPGVLMTLPVIVEEEGKGKVRPLKLQPQGV